MSTYLIHRPSARAITGKRQCAPRVHVFPSGVDVSKIDIILRSKGTKILLDTLRSQFAGKKLLISADRLDYTKGIPKKLHAYDILLQAYAELRGCVQLLLIVAPCRMSIAAYSQLYLEIVSIVQRINAIYALSSWEPIHFVNRVLPYEEMIAYLKVADIAVITPLEDAMNIVAKEFLYAKGDEAGALVLSRNAGAAAYLVNPARSRRLCEMLC